MKTNIELKPLRRTIEINNINCNELLAIDNLSFEQLDTIIKNIITKIEYNPDNYTKLLNENKALKEVIAKLKRDNNPTFLLFKIWLGPNFELYDEDALGVFIGLEENRKLRKIKEEYNTLLKTTFKKITKENYRIKIEYENLLKSVKKNEIQPISNVVICDTNPVVSSISTTENKDDNVDDGQPHMLNENRSRLRKFQKNVDGFYYINGEKFTKLSGTRQEVWDRVAYRTQGLLVLSDLKINNVGDIVSVKKSIYNKINLKDICRPKNKNS